MSNGTRVTYGTYAVIVAIIVAITVLVATNHEVPGALYTALVVLLPTIVITKKVEQLHVLVNSRMSEMIEVTKSEGELQGAKDQRRATKAGEYE